MVAVSALEVAAEETFVHGGEMSRLQSSLGVWSQPGSPSSHYRKGRLFVVAAPICVLAFVLVAYSSAKGVGRATSKQETNAAGQAVLEGNSTPGEVAATFRAISSQACKQVGYAATLPEFGQLNEKDLSVITAWWEKRFRLSFLSVPVGLSSLADENLQAVVRNPPKTGRKTGRSKLLLEVDVGPSPAGELLAKAEDFFAGLGRHAAHAGLVLTGVAPLSTFLAAVPHRAFRKLPPLVKVSDRSGAGEEDRFVDQARVAGSFKFFKLDPKLLESLVCHRRGLPLEPHNALASKLLQPSGDTRMVLPKDVDAAADQADPGQVTNQMLDAALTYTAVYWIIKSFSKLKVTAILELPLLAALTAEEHQKAVMVGRVRPYRVGIRHFLRSMLVMERMELEKPWEGYITTPGWVTDFQQRMDQKEPPDWSLLEALRASKMLMLFDGAEY